MAYKWETEDDHVAFKAHGFDCLIHRNEMYGTWCGYVGLPKSHPYYGESCRRIPVRVHGGLNHSDNCHDEIRREQGVDDDLWWIGFDCGHGGDFSPRYVDFFKNAGHILDEDNYFEHYRDQEYVTRQTEFLAEQCKVPR